MSPIIRPSLVAREPEVPFTFGTKAETLERLAPRVRKSRVIELDYFSVTDWRADRAAVLARLETRFAGRRVGVRSSAQGEDGAEQSLAGKYLTLLHVDGGNGIALANAIERVIASYGDKNGAHQVLVQPMVGDVGIVGVAFTHELETGAPYYVVSYDDESGRTDVVTGGTGAHKSVLIWHGADLNLVESPRVRAVVEAVDEVFELCGRVPLDVEFATDRDDAVHLLQARPLTRVARWSREEIGRAGRALASVRAVVAGHGGPQPGLFGTRTVLCEMSDWNPAEMIGVHPRPLAYSLYRELITRSAWRRARARMGYYEPVGRELMVRLAAQPFIDVRASFSSFLPGGLDADLCHRLVDACLERLATRPELHDKVEFEVVPTCFDLSFRRRLADRYPGVLAPAELNTVADAFRALTMRAVAGTSEGSLAWAAARIDRLEARQAAGIDARAGVDAEAPARLVAMAKVCHRLGTVPFAVAARHAFIAEMLLRSLVEGETIDANDAQRLRRSVRTVAGELVRDLLAVEKGGMEPARFLSRYGHLRPGTYDILSLRYDQMAHLFGSGRARVADPGEPPAFALAPRRRAAIAKLVTKAGLEVDADLIVAYIRRAIAERERAKFVFSRHVSDLLEALARWGETLGLDRELLSFVPFEALAALVSNEAPSRQGGGRLAEVAASARTEHDFLRNLHLSHVVRGPDDVYVVPRHRSLPNFITRDRVRGPVVYLSGHGDVAHEVAGRIVCVEHADPGFDWLFSRDIAGLVTMFGGSNSHMAIRCAEFAVPAAIGCGEETFQRVLGCGYVELDCHGRQLRPIDA